MQRDSSSQEEADAVRHEREPLARSLKLGKREQQPQRRPCSTRKSLHTPSFRSSSRGRGRGLLRPVTPVVMDSRLPSSLESLSLGSSTRRLTLALELPKASFDSVLSGFIVPGPPRPQSDRRTAASCRARAARAEGVVIVGCQGVGRVELHGSPPPLERVNFATRYRGFHSARTVWSTIAHKPELAIKKKEEKKKREEE